MDDEEKPVIISFSILQWEKSREEKVAFWCFVVYAKVVCNVDSWADSRSTGRLARCGMLSLSLFVGVSGGREIEDALKG